MSTSPQLEFSLQQLTTCIDRIASFQAESLEELAGRVVKELNERLTLPDDGRPAAALLRFFITRPYGRLHERAQQFVRESFPDVEVYDDLKCLTLLGTVGDEPAWCTLEGSTGHQAIPLVSEEAVAGIPMIARMVEQLGLRVRDVLAPDAALASRVEQRAFDVFHVEHALGSEHIPAQRDFVEPYGIRSVVGFGSMLPTGHLFSVLVFSRAHISEETAKLFRPLGTGTRIAVLPHVQESILRDDDAGFAELDNLRAQHRGQQQLLKVFHETVVEQSDRLDAALEDLRSTNEDLQRTLDDLRETKARLATVEENLVKKYAFEKLRDPATYTLAFTVGTLINIYGQLVVPWLRGQPDVWGAFVDKLTAHPALGVFSMALGYLFPIGVQLHSAVRAQVRTHALQAQMRDGPTPRD